MLQQGRIFERDKITELSLSLKYEGGGLASPPPSYFHRRRTCGITFLLTGKVSTLQALLKSGCFFSKYSTSRQVRTRFADQSSLRPHMCSKSVPRTRCNRSRYSLGSKERDAEGHHCN